MQLFTGADFAIDAQGFLTWPNGERVWGFRLDGETGDRLRNVVEEIRAPALDLPSRKTTRITYHANLPRNHAKQVFSAKPASILGCDVAPFLEATLPGGSLMVVGAAGRTARLNFRWGKIAATGAAGAGWALFILVNRKAAFAETAWRAVDQDYVFGSDGLFCGQIPLVRLPDVTADGAHLGEMVLDHGRRLTQFPDRIGAVKVERLFQDGQMGGRLAGFSISQDGELRAHYTNGRCVALAELAIEPSTVEHEAA